MFRRSIALLMACLLLIASLPVLFAEGTVTTPTDLAPKPTKAPSSAPRFSIVKGVLVDYQGKGEKTVVIPDEVEIIGERAFYKNKDIEKVVLGANVKIIRREAFALCDNLEKVVINSALKEIGPRAFRRCEKLDISFGKQVQEVADDAFEGCKPQRPTAIPTATPVPTNEPTRKPAPANEPTRKPAPANEPTRKPAPTEKISTPSDLEPTAAPAEKATPAAKPTPTAKPTVKPTIVPPVNMQQGVTTPTDLEDGITTPTDLEGEIATTTDLNPLEPERGWIDLTALQAFAGASAFAIGSEPDAWLIAKTLPVIIVEQDKGLLGEVWYKVELDPSAEASDAVAEMFPMWVPAEYLIFAKDYAPQEVSREVALSNGSATVQVSGMLPNDSALSIRYIDPETTWETVESAMPDGFWGDWVYGFDISLEQAALLPEGVQVTITGVDLGYDVYANLDASVYHIPHGGNQPHEIIPAEIDAFGIRFAASSFSDFYVGLTINGTVESRDEVFSDVAENNGGARIPAFRAMAAAPYPAAEETNLTPRLPNNPFANDPNQTVQTDPENNESFVQIVANGGWRMNDSNTVAVSKTIQGTKIENVFDITLQLKTTQSYDVFFKDPDTAVVIVLDISNTMNSAFGGTTRYRAAMNSAEDFLNMFMKANIGYSRVGMVAFNTDAHEIFPMSQCYTEEQVALLDTIMRNQTGKIINAAGYGSSHSRFTNIEGGLKRAWDMLENVEQSNKMVIFISDGFPTTYIKSGYTGYDPYTGSGTPYEDGVFYDGVKNGGTYCDSGTSYSDKAAVYARKMAVEMKEAGVTIFSIGVDVGGQTIKRHVDNFANSTTTVVDRWDSSRYPNNTGYEIGSYDQKGAYENWLKGTETTGIGSGYYFPSSNQADLDYAFGQIMATIKLEREQQTEGLWVATDSLPLHGEHVDFVGFFNPVDGSNDIFVNTLDGSFDPNAYDTIDFNEADQTISWNLKKSGYTTETITVDGEDGASSTTTVYTFAITYRVRLKNEAADFHDLTMDQGGVPMPVDEGDAPAENPGEDEVALGVYKTNTDTSLTYRLVRTENGAIVMDDEAEIFFPDPAVSGYLGEMVLLKMDSWGQPLPDVTFKLEHYDAKIPGLHNACSGDFVHNLVITPITGVTDDFGYVQLNNIPSGHAYKLTEEFPTDDDGNVRPEYADLIRDEYLVLVEYDRLDVKKITPNGNVHIEDAQPDVTTWQGTVVNVRSDLALPTTGGPGTTLYTLAGAGLTGLAALMYSRRRRERRACSHH